MNLPGKIWLPGVECHPSPNADERPEGLAVDLLVIHNISLPPGEFGGSWIEDLFFNQLDPGAHPYFAEISELKVSAHLLIRRDGQVTQYVALDRRAWHAGQSVFCGRERCNDYSIGIELEGSDDMPFHPAQYRSLVQLTKQIKNEFPAITDDRMVGHSDVAPGRKTDPGPFFNWEHFRLALNTHPSTPIRFG